MVYLYSSHLIPRYNQLDKSLYNRNYNVNQVLKDKSQFNTTSVKSGTGWTAEKSYFLIHNSVGNATTLSSSGVTAGTYGNNLAIPVITVDSKGRITTLTTNLLSPSLQEESVEYTNIIHIYLCNQFSVFQYAIKSHINALQI